MWKYRRKLHVAALILLATLLLTSSNHLHFFANSVWAAGGVGLTVNPTSLSFTAQSGVLILIYVLVVGWFRSFVTPLVIMAPIPLTLVGILPAHALMGAFFTPRR